MSYIYCRHSKTCEYKHFKNIELLISKTPLSQENLLNLLKIRNAEKFVAIIKKNNIPISENVLIALVSAFLTDISYILMKNTTLSTNFSEFICLELDDIYFVYKIL